MTELTNEHFHLISANIMILIVNIYSIYEGIYCVIIYHVNMIVYQSIFRSFLSTQNLHKIDLIFFLKISLHTQYSNFGKVKGLFLFPLNFH